VVRLQQQVRAVRAEPVRGPETDYARDCTLLDRWIVDPGSNVHICNTTYFNWRKTSDAKSTDVIFAGATGYQVAAWGEVIVSVNRGNQKKDILLTHVAYVPGFLTNLFALGRCRRSGNHFDSGRNILYKEGSPML
jgi:hypothetical protein